MNRLALIDPAFAGRLCLTLLHSAWQVALLALVAWSFERFWRNRSVERCYALHVAALVAAIAAMPITFALVEVATTTSDAPTAEPPVARAVLAVAPTSPATTVASPVNASQAQAVGPTSTLGGLPAPPPARLPAQATKAGNLSVLWLQVAPWIVALYTVGVTVMLFRLTAGIWRAHRLGKDAESVTAGPLVDALNALARQWSMRIVPTLAQAEHIVVPKIVGFVRPMILLPASAVTGLSPDELDMIIAHELAHVRRSDMWIALIQRLAEALLFFNPALWYLSRRISTLREYCCDELTCRAMSNSDTEPRARYAAALLRVVELARSGTMGRGDNPVPVGSDLAALAASGRSASELRRRVARLFGEPLREPLRVSRGGLLSLGILASLLLTGPIVWNTAADSAPPRATVDGDADTQVGNRPQPKSNAARTGPHRQFTLQVVGPDGKPVSNAMVEIRTGPSLTAEQILQGEFVRKGNYGIFARTDVQGRLVVEPPAKPPRFNVSIKQSGFGPYWVAWSSGSHPQSIPREFTAELEAAWSVGGTVVDSDGKPIDGVSVAPSVDFKKRPGDTAQLGVGTHIATDAEGKWRFDCVPNSKSEVFVAFNHPDFRPVRRPLTRSEFGFARGQAAEAKIVLEPGLTVTGTVTDESGKPVAGALVRTKFLNDIRKAATDEHGNYRLIGCEPRMAKIVVSAKGRALDMREVRVDPEIDPVDFEMQPGGHVRIRVVDEQDNPIPKARIFFQRWRGRIDYFEFDHVGQYTDENGVWEWNEAPLDEFRADICRPGGMQLDEQSLIARDEEYVFRPPRALVVTGKVFDAVTKAPIETFRVIPGLRNRDPRIRMNWIPRESYQAAGGQYRIRLRNAYLAHLVRIEADGYQVATSRDIKTDEGEVEIDFQLQPAKDIAATITSASGEPAAGAKIALGVAGSQISVKNGDIDDGSTYATRLDVDETGRFSIPGRDEPFQLVITHPTGFAYLKSTDGPVPSNVSLTPWARLEGTFRVGPRPAPTVEITLSIDSVHSYGDDVPNIFTHHDVVTDRVGRFVFGRAFPGNGRIGRRISLTVDEGATEVVSSQKVSVELSAGETRQIDLGGAGRPVLGRLMPPTDYADKVHWSFALVNVRADLPPPKAPTTPVEVQDDREKHKAWWESWKRTDEGQAWQAAYRAFEELRSKSLYITASVDRDGTFRIDDMPAGDYSLRVRSSQHKAGQLMDYRFSVPKIDGDRSDQPFDLGELVLVQN